MNFIQTHKLSIPVFSKWLEIWLYNGKKKNPDAWTYFKDYLLSVYVCLEDATAALRAFMWTL